MTVTCFVSLHTYGDVEFLPRISNECEASVSCSMRIYSAILAHIQRRSSSWEKNSTSGNYDALELFKRYVILILSGFSCNSTYTPFPEFCQVVPSSHWDVRQPHLIPMCDPPETEFASSGRTEHLTSGIWQDKWLLIFRLRFQSPMNNFIIFHLRPFY